MAQALGPKQDIGLSTRAVALDDENLDRVAVGRLSYRGGLEIRAREPRFGGLSALDVTADGRTLRALSDGGDWFTARLVHDPQGRLIGLDNARMGDLPIRSGRHGKRALDSESMAPADGGYLVGFEGIHRLERFTWVDGRARDGLRIVGPRGLRSLPVNSGIEALVRLADGRYLAIEEGERHLSGHAKAWIGADARWAQTAYAVSDRYRPTGAVRGPDGTVYVLERRFSWLGGFATRIRAVAPETIGRVAAISGSVIATLEPPLTSENFEGIAAVAGRKGGTLFYLVSDDNFQPLQRTLLLMFELPAKARN